MAGCIDTSFCNQIDCHGGHGPLKLRPLVFERSSSTMSSRPQHTRQTSLDPNAMQNLEKRLSERPDKNELVERNILKDDKGIAPALVAAKEKLQRSQLEDKLDHALQQRPKAEELVKGGILLESEVPVEQE